METREMNAEAERIFSDLRSFREGISGECPPGICSYLAEAYDMVLRRVERGRFEETVSRPRVFSSRFSVNTFRSQYPFGRFVHSNKTFLASQGGDQNYLWKVFEDEKEAEAFLEKIDRGKSLGGIRILTREQFEIHVVGPMLGIDGRILSSIPKDERYVFTLHYSEQRDETLVGIVDLLTGYGCYFAGRTVGDMKKDIQASVSAESLGEVRAANAKFDFFDIRHDRFVVRKMSDFPQAWRNINQGNVIRGEDEHWFRWWREELLKRHGFSGIDFSGADLGD